ncbi:MAG: tRNA (adenosine(37)-N6)-threonylcarbamoyltransferase complex ATPase subunit type 1 TsaE [Bacteroidia bacterium]
MKVSFVCNSLDELPEAAEILSSNFKDELIFAFYGGMGAGKTTFIREFCKVLGSRDAVSSPTYSLVNEYLDSDGNPIYHFDFYRVKSVDEGLSIGFDDYINSRCICLIEWPEKILSLLPSRYVKVSIKANDEVRTFDMEIVSL